MNVGEILSDNYLLSESMLEFTPFNPFQISTYSESNEDSQQYIPSPTESTFLDLSMGLDLSCTHTEATKSVVSSKKGSENHNMVKQLIITMKQMLNPIYSEIGSTQKSRAIIAEIWSIFVAHKQPSKETLRALFGIDRTAKLMEKLGFGKVVKEWNFYQIEAALDELKHQILFRMRESCLKTHLCDRKIQKKERLAAYIQYFLQDELRTGKITYRFGDAATARIEQILAKSKKQSEFIDYCLDSQEVFERFSSLKQVTF